MLFFSEYPDKSHNFTNLHLTLTIVHFRLLFLPIYDESVPQPRRQSEASCLNISLTLSRGGMLLPVKGLNPGVISKVG